LSLFVRPAAAADVEAAYAWYESQRAGLGDEFLDAVRAVFEVLLESPKRYRVFYREVRRANLRRFPYGVLYRVMGDDIVIVACFHASRDPLKWQDRYDA
jgi:plasmid stabilization system protein ParE